MLASSSSRSDLYRVGLFFCSGAVRVCELHSKLAERSKLGGDAGGGEVYCNEYE